MSKYFPPVYNQNAFSCPHCDVLAKQVWSHDAYFYNEYGSQAFATSRKDEIRYSFAKCTHCSDVSFWKGSVLIHPAKSVVEEANPDLPADILFDYNEAKEILTKSPRSAAALLRLALQKTLLHLGEQGKSINDDIKNLVKRGLPVQYQQALDSIRVIGNNAVHPGEISINDTPEIARALFGLVNIICDYFITQPKKIAEIYGSLPEKDRANIAKRDGSAA